MMYLSQRDPAWAKDRLGSSTLTIGRYGCTTTCISMLSDWFGCYRSPVSIAHDASNYTPDGLVVWKRLRFDRMAFDRRAYGRDDWEIRKSLKDKDRAVILEVDRSHWVVGVRPELFGNHYVIIDPWDGKRKTTRAYGSITGAAHFARK